jgi:oxygen-independent coproporphyrinogen-3 oxidase
MGFPTRQIDPSTTRGNVGGVPGAAGLYVHIPFCQKKCPYCDFNTYAGLDAQHQSTVDALCAELARWREPLAVRRITTVFIGGGTPTLLTHAQLTQLMTAIRANFAVADDAEITCEANPGTVDRDKFATLRRLGVNRLSLGVQSFQPSELAFLGRIHNVDDVERAFEAARQAGFDNINLDFMFGLPNQTRSGWRNTLERARSLAPTHLSLYSLIVEPNTPLYHWVDAGQVDVPDDDVAGEHYEIAMDVLRAAGYSHYEVSNWARTSTDDSETTLPALASRHNVVYWHNEDYLGIGPGAHSHLRQVDATGQVVARRWSNRRPVPGYVKRIKQGEDVADFSETLTAAVSMGETMMLGLRLLPEGVHFDRFVSRHGVELMDVYHETVTQLKQEGLLVVDDTRVRLTRRGLMMGNQVFMRFLAEPAAA